MRTTVISAGVVIALCGACLALPASADDVPVPHNCQVYGSISHDGVLVAPGPMAGTTLTISARNSSNLPIPNAIVQVRFHVQNAIRVCADAQHDGVTDANGICLIQLRAAGCVRNTLGGCTVTIYGIEVAHYKNVKSPDNTAHAESQPDGAVDVADLTFFGDEFLGAAAAACHDYDNDADCDVADLTYFGDAFRAELHCTLP